MNLRVVLKTIFPMLAMAAISTLISDDAFARGWGEWGGGGGGGGAGGGGGGSVPEIGAGSAMSALALFAGAAYLLKDRFVGTRNDKSDE